MNEINPKTLLFKKQIIVGDLTFLKVKKVN